MDETRAQTGRYDETLQGYVPCIPEPFWVRHWFFWDRPSCYQCRVKFRNRVEWERHYVFTHLEEDSNA